MDWSEKVNPFLFFKIPSHFSKQGNIMEKTLP